MKRENQTDCLRYVDSSCVMLSAAVSIHLYDVDCGVPDRVEALGKGLLLGSLLLQYVSAC